MSQEIPKKFWHGDKQPVARNVGALKKILEELPDDLPIYGSFSDPIQVVVYNHGKPDMRLKFDEVKDW